MEWREVIDALQVGIVVIDEQLQVALWNRWMEEASGRPRAEVVGRSLAQVFPAVDFATLERKVRQALLLRSETFLDAASDGYLFPIKNEQQIGRRYDLMRQDVTVAPLKTAGAGGRLVCLTISDRTSLLTATTALEEANRHLARLSQRDSLTDMYNRGYAYEILIHELGRGRRYGQHPTSVLILDLDHFKKINDARGHLIGDEVLRQVSQTLKRSVREVDIPGRYGGEEFIVIMPETPLEGAHQVAERIRTAVAALRIEARGGPVPISVSIGVAERREGEGADQILARADSALYEAKNAGRNRTVLAA